MMPSGTNPAASESVKILLVEDDPDDQRLLRRALLKTGRRLSIDIAFDGQAAVEYLAALAADGDRPCPRRPVLVLSDVNLPLRSGWELLDWIRNRPRLSGLPFLLWTSLPTPEGAERAKRLGAVRYFSKPQNLEGYAAIAASILSILGD